MAQPQPLERTARVSPLLSEAVIERDYTQGIESQINQPSEPKEPKINVGEQAQDAYQQKQTQQTQGFETGGDFEAPNAFTFDAENDDPSDVTDEDPQSEGFELASSSAKVFANVIGDLIKSKAPELMYQYCKIDTNSIEVHVANGNIHPGARDVVIRINEQTLEQLAFSDDEIKMWKKAFKEFLEYNNVKAANPNTAFILATATLVVTAVLKARQLKKSNEELVFKFIESYNPGYFDSFAAKKEEAPKEVKTKPHPENKTEKTEV